MSRSGGYAHGLIGCGIFSRIFLKNKIKFFLEFKAGAGVGAGVDTGEGLIVKPSIGISYNITNNFSFLSSIGFYYTPYGNVNSKNINIGLSFNFSTLSLK